MSFVMEGYVVKVVGDFNGDKLIDFYLMKVDDYGCLIGEVNDFVWFVKFDGEFVIVVFGVNFGIIGVSWVF